VLICGSSERIDAMLAWLAVGPEHARVRDCHASPYDLPELPVDFVIAN